MTSGPDIALKLSEEYSKANISTLDTKYRQLERTVYIHIDSILSTDKAKIAEGLQRVDSVMRFSMHPIGFTFTAGDLLLWGAIKGSPHILSEVSSGKYAEIERWYKDCMELLPFIAQVNTFQKELTAVPHLTILLTIETKDKVSAKNCRIQTRRC